MSTDQFVQFVDQDPRCSARGRRRAPRWAPAALALLAAACGGSPAPRPPPPPAGAYFTGAYPDLFVELLGVTPEAVQARVDAAWQQLFYGDDATERVYYPVGQDMAYVTDVLHGDVRSEGMSYAMMIAVQLDKQAEFDRLWTWARTYMQFQSGPHQGYLAWQLGTDGTVLDPNSASDGEEWFATALLLAANRWGSGTGILDYQAEAQRILDAMLHKHEQPDRGSVTDMFDAGNHLVVFVPAGNDAGYTDPSYHLPHFYELWGRWAARDRDFWCQAAAASRAYLRTAADATTGLAPDYALFDGTPYNPSWNTGPSHVDFRADAWRVAGNVGVDHLWFAADPWQVEQSDRLQAFFRGQDLATYGSSYSVTGTRLNPTIRPPATGLVAMNAAAALAAADPGRADFVQALWDRAIPSGSGRYYDGLLYLLGLLETSGNFRVYPPAGGQATGCNPAAAQGR